MKTVNRKRLYLFTAALLAIALMASCTGSSPPATTAAATTAAAAATEAATTAAAAAATEAAATTTAAAGAATTAAAAAATTTAAAATVAAADDAQELVEIEFMNMSQTWVPVVFGDDPVTKIFMEKTGVKMICSAPQGDGDQIANVMLASGDYPEMMHMNINATQNKYVAAGALYSMNELAEQYGYPDVINGTNIYEDVMRVRSSEDGLLYIAPNWFSDDGFGSVGTAVNMRNDIYTQLGSPTIETVDDLLDYLAEVKSLELKTPDGLNVYPLAYGHTDRNFIGYIANWWGSNIFRFMYYNEDTQTVDFFLRNPDVLEAVKFLSACLRDGYLDPEVLTFDSTQQTEAWSTGKYAVILTECWNLWANVRTATTAIDPEMYYVSVPPPQGTPGKTPYFGRYHTIGGSGTMITKNCKNPEAAIRFVDYFLSPEGEILNFYGVEGDAMYFDEAGAPWLYDFAYEEKLIDWSGAGLKYGIRIFDMMNNAKYNWERTQETEDRQYNRKIAMDTAFDGSLLSAILIDPDTDEGILFAEIEANIRSELTSMIMEADPARIESMLGSTLAEYERRGIAKLESYASDFYNLRK
ncbi:MAG: extracellular solute-binding protein [Oscillospiraceae bacterium]|nr:extracellular solute-binding protein [Oscillospiraceae bacterium]